MKTSLLTVLAIFLLIVSSSAQKIDYSDDLIIQLENSGYSRSLLLEKENLIDEYNSYDFSTLFIPKHDFLGYIGFDFERLKIYFKTISKDETNKNLYHINGFSVVKENKCDFDGFIKILQIRKLRQMHFGLDQTENIEGYKAQGVLIGKYEFKENPYQKHVGTFQGKMFLRWFVDKFDIIHYDDIEWFSDSYNNLQFAGTWKSNTTGLIKITNWGDHRIPYSGDLDIGVAEFFPDRKYKDKGWEDFIK